MNEPTQYPETPPKRKNRSPLRVIVNAWGCLLALVMLALGATLGLVGAAFFAPQIFGFDATATALADDAIVLASTQAEISFRASESAAQRTEFARDSEATRAAIGYQEVLLGQTATQSQRYIVATQTAIADANTRLQTQIALDYQATQAQLQENATAAEIDFRNTQAALGVQVTPAAPAIGAQSLPESTPAALPPTQMPTDALPPASDTPTPARVEVETNFAAGWDAEAWSSLDSDAWETGEEGVVSLQDGVWFLSAETVRAPYTFEVAFTPAVVIDGVYDVLLSVGEEEGLVLRLVTEGLAASEVEFYRFDVSLLDDGALRAQDMVLVQRTVVSMPLTRETVIRVVVTPDELEAQLNGEMLLSLEPVEGVQPGAVGFAMPQDATLLRFSLVGEP